MQYFEIDWSYGNVQELDFKLQRPKVNNQTMQVERSWCESSCQRLFPPNFSFNNIKEICPQKDLRVWPTLTKGELLGDLQDEPNRPRDVLHLQCNGCRGDLQVSLSLLVKACQCSSMLINACQCLSMLVNARQCLSMFVNACQCLSMLLISDQSCQCCWSAGTFL